MPYKVSHVPGLTVAAMVLATQFEAGWFFQRDLRPAVSPRMGRALWMTLCAIWTITVAGMLIDLIGVQSLYALIPPSISIALVGFATLWGFNSGISINLYAICRFLFFRTPNVLPEAEPVSAHRRHLLQAATTVAIAAPFGLTAFGLLIERTRYEVREIDFPIPNLHPDLEGLRFAQISDLHVSPYLSVREAGRVVDITNELKPNLTLVTGDLISQRGDPLDGTIRELARLKADAGVLGCLGNHEIYANCQSYATREAAKVGIQFLRQRAIPLRWGAGTLNVAGVDFEPFARRRHYLECAGDMLLPGAANLLLSHNPDVFPAAVRLGFDAMLSGHTHGGQVTVEILNQTANLARFFTPYVAGLYRREGRSCYVNAGIGTIGMPVRLGAPPEISLLRLRRA